jgi:DNA-binding response OmpR family regulator
MKRLFIIDVLLIEDSALARKAVKEGLKNFNFEFEEAVDGATGISVAKRKLPDLILLDLNLPDMNGLEVLKELRSDKDTAAIPVIIISTSNQAGIVAETMKAGAQYYLTKPPDIGKLLLIITKLLKIEEEEISSLSFKKP